MPNLPFGLDLKTAVVTIIFVYLVLPYLLGFFMKAAGGGRKKAPGKA